MKLREGKLYKVSERSAPQWFFVAPYLKGKLNGEKPKQWEDWDNVMSGPYLLIHETGEEPDESEKD